MNILGPDRLVFSVEDLDDCLRFAVDYGLTLASRTATRAFLEALDGTGLEIRLNGDPELPPASAPSPNLREAVYGVADRATLDAIAAELRRDRTVTVLADGALRSHDEDGYPIGFQVTVRRAIDAPHYGVNVPGQPYGRAMNVLGARDDDRPLARTLSHIVMFTQDRDRAERFYAQRLGFRTVDVFTNLGPFMRPAGTNEHHTLFLIQAPVRGLQHFTFHFAGANEVLKAGWEFQRKGYRSPWGPGRHILGSNYFWYFNSPFGAEIEMDADMDAHDDSWVPRRVPATDDSSQVYLLKYTEKWSPNGKG